MPAICSAIREYTRMSAMDVPGVSATNASSMLSDTLIRWSALVAPKPLIVLFDEVDVLEGDAMVSFLRQLRGGFASRGVGAFPVSVALVGMRDLKDYITKAKDGRAVNPGSPFNVKEDSAVLSNFTKEDVVHLFAQRTAENGQQITQEALDYVYKQSKGQPWIVNSLFKRATLRILDEASTETVTVEHIEEARQQMILARETHLDALAYRLEDPAVRALIEKLITGVLDPTLAESETFRICIDLGLVTVENGTPQVANPIYREVIARHLTYSTQLAIPAPEWQWQKPDGTLDMDSLLREFQGFWQTHSEEWEEMSGYSEAFPHLLLMAFLQRVTNGDGHIEREYAAGRGRMDLAVEYMGRWDIIEVKLRRKGQSIDKVKETGIQQILRYRNSFSPPLCANAAAPTHCYLVVFDRRPEAAQIPWSDRLKWSNEGEVTIVEC
ncbi:MAG: PD-(D/E)XK nuclease domain-containing protein [Prevotellaceae bacterium]|jgi:hypothetical protein|nr:PD-(D/E)XK nuclease domain-containing protein [Prevotellaceae bacterium]